MTWGEEPVALTTYLTARPGSAAELRDRLLETVGPALARPGARGFSILRSTADDNDFLVVERWSGDAAAQAAADAPILHDVEEAAQPVAKPGCWRRII